MAEQQPTEFFAIGWMQCARRHDPATSDERGAARMLRFPPIRRLHRQGRESAWTAFENAAHRIVILFSSTVRQGQGLSGVAADEQGRRTAIPEAWTSVDPTTVRGQVSDGDT